MKSPLKRYGGKYHFLKHLLPRIPEHKCYVEVFCGAAHLYFAKTPAKVNVLNDIDSDIANFFRVLQDKTTYDKFMHKLKHTPYSRELYELSYQSYKMEIGSVDKALHWFTILHQSFGSKVIRRGFSRSSKCSSAKSFKNLYNTIEKCVDVLKNAVIENVDWKECIRLYDTPNTFFYLDPPYVHSTRTDIREYKHEMINEQHQSLVDTLQNIQGKYLLSGFENKIYEPLPNIEHFAHRSNTGQAGERQRTECLWSNYTTQPSLFDFGQAA